MGLIIPNFSWGYDVSNYVTAFSSSTPGTNFTMGANDTYGANVAVISTATTYDTHYMIIGIGGTGTGSQVDNCGVADILYDPAGGTSWSVLISSLLCGYAVTPGTSSGLTVWYHFPIRVPAGSTIGIRAKMAYTVADSTGGRVVISMYGKPSRPSLWWSGQKVETLGISGSKGTSVTPGATGASGSWTTIGTSSARYGAYQIGLGPTHSAMVTARGYHVFAGTDSTQLAGSIPIHCNTSTTYHTRNGQTSVRRCNVAAGTVWQAMATCSSTSPDALSVAFYGVY